jgi:hypothetical protein
MSTTTKFVIAGIAVASIIGLWVMKKQEDFSIHSVNEPGCISSTASLPANSDEMNVSLQPNTVRLAIQGYNYQETPVFYRDDKKIIPMEYAWDSDELTYYFTLAAPSGVCNHSWIIETYDFVEPIVMDQDSYKFLTVASVRRRLGFNRWRISCS